MKIIPELADVSNGLCSVALEYQGDVPVDQVEIWWRAGDVRKREESVEWWRVRPNALPDRRRLIDVPEEWAREELEITASKPSMLGEVGTGRLPFLWRGKYRLEDGPGGSLLIGI